MTIIYINKKSKGILTDIIFLSSGNFHSLFRNYKLSNSNCLVVIRQSKQIYIEVFDLS